MGASAGPGVEKGRGEAVGCADLCQLGGGGYGGPVKSQPSAAGKTFSAIYKGDRQKEKNEAARELGRGHLKSGAGDPQMKWKKGSKNTKKKKKKDPQNWP